jgi:hypothetical protein
MPTLVIAGNSFIGLRCTIYDGIGRRGGKSPRPLSL